MKNVFFISDTHFGHASTFSKFLRADGVTPLRHFTSVEEMDETMIENWNDAVKPTDKVYVLGDVAISKNSLKAVMPRLNGDKVLIKGNHDIYKVSDYSEYFRDIRAYHVLDGMILCHIPIHAASLGRFGSAIHGHLHEKRVLKPRGVNARTGEILYSDEIDPRYFNVSVECIDYRPISLEELQARIVLQGGSVGFRNGNYGTVM